METDKKIILIRCEVPGVGGWCNKYFPNFGNCAKCYEAEKHLTKIAKNEAAKPGTVSYLAGPGELVPVDITSFNLEKDEWNTLWGSNLKLLDGSDRTVANVCKGQVSRFFRNTGVEQCCELNE